MAGFAKGMAIARSWTLLRCDCRNRIHQVRQRRVARARRRWWQQPVHGGCNVQDSRLCMTPATAKHFLRLWMQLCVDQASSEGGHGGVYDDQAARRTTRPDGLQPADLIDNYVMKPMFSRRYVTFLTAFKPLLFGALLMPIILA